MVLPMPIREWPNGIPFVDVLIADHESTTSVPMTILGLSRPAIGPVTGVTLDFSGGRKRLHRVHEPKVSSGRTRAAFNRRFALDHDERMTGSMAILEGPDELGRLTFYATSPLETVLESNGPVPLLADDVLILFDNGRAAALRLWLASSAPVWFYSHMTVMPAS